MKKVLFILATLFAFASCNKEGGSKGGSSTITVDFATPDKVYVGVPAQFTAKISGGTAPYSCTWDFGDGGSSNETNPSYTYETTGMKVVTLQVTDSKGNKARQPKSKTVSVANAPIEEQGDISIVWYAELGAADMRGSSPAIDDQGNVYIATSKDGEGKIHKVSSAGQIIASTIINASPSNTCMSPSIDSQGNVYVGGGSASGGSFHKYSSTLTDLWSGTFWNKGNAASLKMWYGAAVQVNDNFVLVGNAGSTGSLVALSKTDGSLHSYITATNDKGEIGGPSGGCRLSPAVSKDGHIWQLAKGGLFTLSVSEMLTSGPHDAGSNLLKGDLAHGNDDRPAGVVVPVNSENHFVALTNPGGSTTQFVRVNKTMTDVKKFVIDETNTSIASSQVQDQGGLIVGANNQVIANLKCSEGSDNGGIVAIDPATMTLAWEFRIGEEVACAPAYTKEGNIIFGTDQGNFYIITPNANKKADVVAKANIKNLLKAKGMTFKWGDEDSNIKLWSNVVVGDNGEIYIGYRKEDEVREAGLLKLSSTAVTGPGNSCWPMFGVDRKHTGVQK